MNLADRFLTLYDGCKQARSPEECRQVVINAVPTVMRSYLGAYDSCLRLFKPETCRKVFAPTRERSGLIAFAAGAASGFLLSRLLRR